MLRRNGVPLLCLCREMLLMKMSSSVNPTSDASLRMPPGYDLRLLGDVDSTNAEATRILRNFHDDSLSSLPPTWILASSQKTGRGRHGRNWASPSGNLYTTLLMCPGVNAATASQLSLATALAVRDVIMSFLPGGEDEVTLKWPNDVLVGGAKLAGILLELHPSSSWHDADDILREQGMGWIAIGIGVNLLHFPPDAPYPATSLHALGSARLEPLEVLCALAWALDARLCIWKKGADFASLRAEWEDCAYGLGEEVSAGLGSGGGEMRGIFLGLDNNGALRLRLKDGGECSLCAADIRFLRTKSFLSREVYYVC